MENRICEFGGGGCKYVTLNSISGGFGCSTGFSSRGGAAPGVKFSAASEDFARLVVQRAANRLGERR